MMWTYKRTIPFKCSYVSGSIVDTCFGGSIFYGVWPMCISLLAELLSIIVFNFCTNVRLTKDELNIYCIYLIT